MACHNYQQPVALKNYIFKFQIFQCYRVKSMRRLYIKWQWYQCHATYQQNRAPNRIYINDIFLCIFFKLLSQANIQSPYLLIKTTMQHTTKVKYLYYASNVYFPFLLKTTKNSKKLNLLINQQNEHHFISQARFVTSHLIPFNSQNYRIICRSLIFQCQPYTGPKEYLHNW